MARILLIDDDPVLLEVLAMAFEDAGHAVHLAPDGLQGLARLRTDRPDLVISDVNLPGLDGFSLCRQLREAGDPMPVILLTARDHEVDEALGLEFGADDYVAKPCSTRLLLARVTALLRRDALRQAPVAQPDVTPTTPLDIRSDHMEIRYLGRPVPMTVSEFRLVEALARRPGIVLSRDRLLTLVRGDDSVVADRIIDTYVRRVRRKFEQVDAHFDRIETVVGMGYRWLADA
jgi:DNA-binding response OmpR family regulator